MLLMSSTSKTPAWSRATEWQAFDLVVGKVFAFAFVLAALAVSAYALHLGHPAAGALLGSSTLALVVGAFRLSTEEVKKAPTEADALRS
jgi:hypothetical protein